MRVSQPLVIVGAPRSGTTFLCHTLNQHPDIELTNESRIFAFVKHLLDVQSDRPDLVHRGIQTRFETFVRRHSGLWIERFYREELGITAPIWGDKHPPYADPTILSSRIGPAAVIETLNKALNRVLQDATIQEKLLQGG